jgi:phosphatidylserine/phosphatidylglycerophosphate/cardiolipin synthase-like enzyme
LHVTNLTAIIGPMRALGKGDGLDIQLIAGTYVVLVGISVDPDRVEHLLGFSIERTDHTGGERSFLYNNLLFEENDVGARPDYSTEKNPVQAFVWGDYTAKPGHTYTYEVTARYGSSASLGDGPNVAAAVTTENPEGEVHGIYFNRSVAASAAYQRRFGNTSPADVENGAAYAWLSRGLEEALVAFIGKATDERCSLRASVYEFTFDPVLEAFKVAHEAGADVKIAYHKLGEVGEGDRDAIAKAGIGELMIPRSKVNISHNKFVVLLKDGKPLEVWTGSTNITDGGLFGQANVGHRISDPTVAAAYLAYWEQISQNPSRKDIYAFDDPNPRFAKGRPRAQLTTVFSPRSNIESLNWYVRLADSAKQGVFLTAAFGLQAEIAPVFEGDRDYLRYLLLDTDEGETEALKRDPDNIVTAGAYTGTGAFRAWIAKALWPLDRHVHYLHTKLMLVDPLTDDPLVITGSGNWSNESCEENDENMVVIRGDKRVGDIYLTEFMRLFNHYRLRGTTKTPKTKLAPGPGDPSSTHRPRKHLASDSSWAEPFYAPGSPEEKERRMFAGSA